MADHRGKLDKETRDRHFPELNGGKGSLPRKSTKSSRQAYSDNWDRIFGGKDSKSTVLAIERYTPRGFEKSNCPSQGHEQYISEIISNLSDPEMEYDSIVGAKL